MPAQQKQQYTFEEVEKHNKEGDLWIVIDSKVYDLSRFADLHPGGPNVLYAEGVAGKDATDTFFGLHRHEVLLRPQYARLQIGTIQGEEEMIKAPIPGSLSKVPYAEATWLSDGYFSPYYTDNHRAFQQAIRKFFEEVVRPEAIKCEENGKRISQEVVDKMSDLNIIAMRLGPGKHLHGRTLLGGLVKPEEFDYFHELILNTEISRFGTRGFSDGMLSGATIGLPPVWNYGSPELQAKVVPEVLSGKKYLALAITEAFAGSDVSGLQTTAVRDGDYWIVTGTKKWITNGTFADYFTTGCKTEKGLTVILIERGEGVSTKPIKTSYSATAGTAYVTFDKVRVPIGNTLGAVGNGLSVILSNFNHERWMVTAMSVGAQRIIVEECLKWANQRIVFGKPLTSQAVIRNKLGKMITRIEACQNWLEIITHQMNNVRERICTAHRYLRPSRFFILNGDLLNIEYLIYCNTPSQQMTYNEMSSKLAGQIGLLKQFVSRCGRETAEDATQVFGGRALTVTGMGKLVENYHRTSGFDAILAGAEDVLGDLGVRQAMKRMPKDARL
ncbi:acyl-CoA dehydrogenase NM domain-like protein [Gymnopus androsaceus JB14]|uniref:Acyl-CoA dehydrogenase NM domain-like protein n=1 Tax=Gymnopus androsaceus JB14 TaxID=1447944 RepID=A0A6A4HQ33_9AGAR|nr:acyl-CoA dehydrogenase NM domain-like protein [Gymnopus androsaceus JB14]